MGTVWKVVLALLAVVVLGGALVSYLQYAVGAIVVALAAAGGLYLLARWLLGSPKSARSARAPSARAERKLERQAQRNLREMEKTLPTTAAARPDEAAQQRVGVGRRD